jgi:hypothetical protein
MVNSCKKSDPPLPDNLVQFETGEQGFGSDVSTMNVKLTLSRNTDKDIPVEISLTENGVQYGRDYTTEPAAVNNSLSLTIPSGSSSVSFTISKASDIFLQGDEYGNLSIEILRYRLRWQQSHFKRRTGWSGCREHGFRGPERQPADRCKKG